MITYRVRLDVPRELVRFVHKLLARRRKEIGTRKNTRSLSTYQQAVLSDSPVAVPLAGDGHQGSER